MIDRRGTGLSDSTSLGSALARYFAIASARYRADASARVRTTGGVEPLQRDMVVFFPLGKKTEQNKKQARRKKNVALACSLSSSSLSLFLFFLFLPNAPCSFFPRMILLVLQKSVKCFTEKKKSM